MAVVQFGQFALPGVLRAIGRKLLYDLLAHFEQDLAARNIRVPNPGLPDDDYFNGLAALFGAEETLPERLNQALFTIEEMASPEGQERLQAAVAHAGLKLILDSDCSPECMSVQVWLEAPDVLFREHLKQDLARLTSFVGFGTSVPKAERLPFVAHDHPGMRKLIAPIAHWFARHNHAVPST